MAPILVVEEIKAIPKGVCSHNIACIRFEDRVHTKYFAILGNVSPAFQHLLELFLDDWLKTTDAGI